MEELTENGVFLKLAAYCSRAERCEFDVIKKMNLWNFNNPEHIKNIVNKLRSENFLNEERFCKAYINDKILYNKWGINKISYELKRRNISEKKINYYLSSFSDSLYEEQLTKILNSKIKTIKYKDQYDLKSKLFRYALGKGYTYDLTKRCLSKLL